MNRTHSNSIHPAVDAYLLLWPLSMSLKEVLWRILAPPGCWCAQMPPNFLQVTVKVRPEGRALAPLLVSWALSAHILYARHISYTLEHVCASGYREIYAILNTLNVYETYNTRFWIILRWKERTFHNRSTKWAAFCAIQWMSFKPTFILCNSNN